MSLIKEYGFLCTKLFDCILFFMCMRKITCCSHFSFWAMTLILEIVYHQLRRHGSIALIVNWCRVIYSVLLWLTDQFESKCHRCICIIVFLWTCWNKCQILELLLPNVLRCLASTKFIRIYSLSPNMLFV